MSSIFYEEGSLWPFLIATLFLGGWAAWMTARGIASTWRPFWQCVLALLALGFAVRFLHFALFEGTLLSPGYYASDTVILLIIGSAGFRLTRASQITRQYRWLYQRTGPFTWRERRETPKGESILPG
jgi:hypothetical protein